MRILHTWKRNSPSTLEGESITVKITYSSFDKGEIDELEKKMPNGMIFSETTGGKNAGNNADQVQVSGL